MSHFCLYSYFSQELTLTNQNVEICKHVGASQIQILIDPSAVSIGFQQKLKT